MKTALTRTAISVVIDGTLDGTLDGTVNKHTLDGTLNVTLDGTPLPCRWWLSFSFVH